MTTELDQLTAARPPGAAADLYSQAERRELLASITSTRRETPARGPIRMRPRIAVAAVTVAAAAVGGTLIAQPWHHSGPRLGNAAYRVTPHADGSVDIVIRWSQLRDPAKLQADLDAAGAHVRILIGTETIGDPDSSPPVPPCAKPFYGVGYSAKAVQWDFPDRASEVNGIVVRPKYFPAGGTFVIEAFTLPGRHDYSPTLSFMVVGKVPTCVAPVVGSGPGVGVPTR